VNFDDQNLFAQVSPFFKNKSQSEMYE